MVRYLIHIKDARDPVSRLVDLNEEDLAFQVCILDVIPLSFGGLNEKAAVNNFSFNSFGTIIPVGSNDKIRYVLESQGFVFRKNL